jgi:hypothetical protein
MMTRAQIAERIAQEEKLGAEYEAAGNIGEAQVHWNLAAQWRSQLNAPGREQGEGAAPPDPRGAALFDEKAPIQLDPQIIVAEAKPVPPKAPPKKASAPVAAALPALAAAYARPGGVPGAPPRPIAAEAMEAGGRAVQWLGVALLGSGLGYLALRFVKGRAR